VLERLREDSGFTICKWEHDEVRLVSMDLEDRWRASPGCPESSDSLLEANDK